MLRTVAALRIVQGTSLARHVARAPGASFHTTTELQGMHKGQTHFPKNFGKPTGKESFRRPTQAMVKAEKSYWLDGKKVPITLDPKTSNEAISRFLYYEFLRQSSYEFTKVANTIRSWRGTILQQYMGRAYVDLDLKMPFNLITQSEKSLERPSLALNETQLKKVIRAQHLYYNLVDNVNRDPVLAASIIDSLNEKYPSKVKLTVEKMAETDPVVNMTPSDFSTATKYALGRERGIKVFPDVIDSFDPYVRLKVVYKAVVQDGDLKSVAKNYEKKEGEEVEDILLEGHRAQDLQLVPSLTLNEPLIEFSRYVSKSRPFYHPNHETDPTVFYTLLLVDADEPARNVSPNQQRLHWLVGNIPDANFLDGETLASYIPPVPASGTRLHRYAFILLEQLKGRVDYSDFTKLDSKTLSPRDNFSVRTFAEKYNLHGRGASAFHAEWDSSVTETYKTFTDVQKEPRFMLASKWAKFSDRLPVPSTRYVLPWGTGLADVNRPFQEIRRIREQV